MIFSEKEIKVAIDKDIEVEAEKIKNYMRNVIESETSEQWSTGKLARNIKKKKITVAEYDVGILDEDVAKFNVRNGQNYAYIYANGRGAIDLTGTNRYMVIKDKTGKVLRKTQKVKGYGGNDFVGKTISKFG